ncbi:amidase family protein [Tabrizicola oligotrophica]|uniref:Amidase family protein n=1 Tax=Tabrizicola oligotrophica TaxID=2710650 RepID=A0A6M0QSK3_9RHOB|nr:amidase family protein [Tabrizicola oligotrophica]NEY90435.1 amidase family protein [Tabrizicola oligotrophica]
MTDLASLTATETAALVTRREVSARQVAEASLARIEARNPALNAIVQRMDAEALAAADAVDERLRRGEDAGPLAGVPVTIKVIADQAGHATTNGLRSQKDLIATEDNPVVAALRRAGAVIVGRTNTPAFSLRWFTRNGLHGATKNPLDAALTPGGSSGGAGAAVAAGMGAIAHGTDIAGSIRYPAYACGVHGLRPSLGRVAAFNPSGGDRLIGAQLMAVSGPLARSIPDLRLALQAMAAPDPRDAWYQPMPLQGPPAPRRVALVEAPDGMAVAAPVRAALQAAAETLRAAGYRVEPVQTPPWAEAMALQLRLWMAEFRHSNLAGLRAEDDPDANFVYAQMTRHCPEIDLHGLMDTLKSRARLTRLWRGFLADWPLVLCPVSGELAFPDQLDVASEAGFDRVLAAQMPLIATPFMGLPGLTVTTGRHGGAPVGVQLVADQFREDLLLAAGEVLAPSPIPAV